MSSSLNQADRASDYLLGLLVLVLGCLLLYWTGRFLQPVRLPPASPGSYHYVARLDSVAPGAAVAFEMEGRDWLLARNGDGITAVSAYCTFRGSRVRWDKDNSLFVCEGHGCTFGPQGDLIHGLATSPLEGLRTRIIDGRVYASRDFP